MDERYSAAQSQRIQDTRWIEEATLAGDILLCKNLAIAQNPLDAQGIYMTSAKLFARRAYAVPATPIRLPSGSVKWPTTRPVGARSGPI